MYVSFMADVGKFQSCNLARIPSRVIMGRSGGTMKIIKQKLLHLHEFLLLKPDLFQLFNSSAYGSKDLLFKESTVRLVDVTEKNSTEAWLGEKYFKALKTLRSCQKVAAAVRSFGEKLKTWKAGQLLCFYLALFFSFLRCA